MYDLNEKEIEAINNLKFDKDLKPRFEEIKYCLIWADEVDESLSRMSRELVYDLLIYRGLLHRELPRDEWPVNLEYFDKVFKYANEKVPNWIGFKRMILSEEDKAYLLDCMEI